MKYFKKIYNKIQPFLKYYNYFYIIVLMLTVGCVFGWSGFLENETYSTIGLIDYIIFGFVGVLIFAITNIAFLIPYILVLCLSLFANILISIGPFVILFLMFIDFFGSQATDILNLDNLNMLILYSCISMPIGWLNLNATIWAMNVMD